MAGQNRAQHRLGLTVGDFVLQRQTPGQRRQIPVEERQARFQTGGHGGPVGFHAQIVGQIGRDIRQHGLRRGVGQGERGLPCGGGFRAGAHHRRRQTPPQSPMNAGHDGGTCRLQHLSQLGQPMPRQGPTPAPHHRAQSRRHRIQRTGGNAGQQAAQGPTLGDCRHRLPIRRHRPMGAVTAKQFVGAVAGQHHPHRSSRQLGDQRQGNGGAVAQRNIQQGLQSGHQGQGVLFGDAQRMEIQGEVPSDLGRIGRLVQIGIVKGDAITFKVGLTGGRQGGDQRRIHAAR